MRSAVRPVFVVGSPRSGTSILTWSLGQHPNLLQLEETGWLGPGLVDLAALATGWEEPWRRALARAYAEEADAAGGEEELLRGLDLCALHLALRWVGWSESWQPPPEHARDWLGEVLDRSRRLGVPCAA